MKKLPLLLLFFFLALAVIACTGPGRGSGPEPANAGSGYDDVPRPRFSTPVTREEIREAFYRYSAVAIVRALRENGATNWDMILHRIESGDRDWILNAMACIAPGTDAAATTELIAALALALPNNPETILGLHNTGYGISLATICSMPFYTPSYDFLKEYGEIALVALSGVKQQSIIPARDTCRRHLIMVLDNAESKLKQGRWFPE